MRKKPFKGALEQFPLFLYKSCITLSFAFYHFHDPTASTLIVCNCSLCSIFILQKHISFPPIIVYLFFVNYRFSILFSFHLLSPHPIHASSLLSSRNVNCWKMCFSFNKSSKTYRTSHSLNDVIHHWFYKQVNSSVMCSVGIFPKWAKQ